MLVYSPEGVIVEQTANINVGGRILHHNKLCTATNSWNTLVRFAVSGNSQNVFLSIKAESANDRSTITNTGNAWHKFSWKGVYCNSSGTMVDAYTSFYREAGSSGGSFDWNVASNYVDLQIYLWSDVVLVNLPMYVVCSDWSKVTVTYY